MSEFSATLDDLVLRTRRLLEDSPEVDSVTAALTASGTTLTVASPRLFGKGTVAEIEDELVYTTTDISGFATTIRRGYRSTTAATHASGTVVYVNPRYPRINIKEAINVVVGNWISFYAPRLVWDITTAGTFQPQRDIYACPSDAINVLDVAWKTPGRINSVSVNHGPLEPFDTTLVSTGAGVRVFEHGMPGQTVRLLLEKPWPYMSSGSDTVPSDFPPMMDNLITDGAVLYLLGWRLSPKFRAEEAVFSREQSSSLPPQFAMADMEIMLRNWTRGVHRMANMRAQPTKPKRVIRD